MQEPAEPPQQEGGPDEGHTGSRGSLSTPRSSLNSYSLAASSKEEGHQASPSSPQAVARRNVHKGRSASSHERPHLGQKPAIPEKSVLVLMAAREILRQKRKRLERSASDSELYDDVISFRSSYFGVEGDSVTDEDTYDDIISVLASSDNDGIYDDVIAVLAASNEDELYDDVISALTTGNNVLYDNIPQHPANTAEVSTSREKPHKPVKPAWLSDLLTPKLVRQVSRRHSFDDVYDDTVVMQTRRLARPNKPEKPASLQQNAKVMQLLQQLREKSSQAKSQESTHGTDVHTKEGEPQNLPLISTAGVQPRDSNVPIRVTSHSGITAPLSVSHQQSRNHHQLGIPRTGEGPKESEYLSLLPPSPMAAHRRIHTAPRPGGEAPEQEGEVNGHNSQSSTADVEESTYENESIVGGRRIQCHEHKKPRFNFGSFSDDRSEVSKKAEIPPTTTALAPVNVSFGDVRRRQKALSRSNSLPHSFSDDYKAPDSPTPPSASLLPANRRTYDPLPDIEEARPHYVEYLASLRAPESFVEEADTYEYLQLYEDLHQYQEGGGEGYQDLDGAITQALGLPEQMRERVKRITGKQRNKMQKSMQHARWKVQRSQTLPASDLSGMQLRRGPRDVVGDDMDHTRLSSDPSSNRSKSKDGAKGEGGQKQDAASGCDTTGGNEETNQTRGAEGGVAEGGGLAEGSDSSADENESIPFGKSRVVFEMLLDASGIQRIPKGEPASQQTEAIEPSAAGEDSSDEGSVSASKQEASYSPFFDCQELDRIYDTPELRHYQEAGIIQPLSKSELDQEIRRITSNAPSDPPPLPGFIRPRTRVMTRTDKVLHKRFLLKRRQRPKTTPAIVNAPKGRTSIPPGAPPPPMTPPPPSTQTPPPGLPSATPPPHSRTLTSQPPPPSSPSLSSNVPPSTTPQLPHPTAVRDNPPESEVTYQNVQPPPPSPSLSSNVPPTTTPQTHPTAVCDSPPESEVTYQNFPHNQLPPSSLSVSSNAPPTTTPQPPHPTVRDNPPEFEVTYQNVPRDQPTTASQQATTIHPSTNDPYPEASTKS